MKIRVYHNIDGTVRIAVDRASNLERILYADVQPGETATIDLDSKISYTTDKSEKITTK